MPLPDYNPNLFEPLTFKEFAYVFELTEEDIKEIESIEVLKNWINRGIAGANKNVEEYRSSYKIADERTNIAFYRHFARMLGDPRPPGYTGYSGVTPRLAKRFNDWRRRHGY